MAPPLLRLDLSFTTLKTAPVRLYIVISTWLLPRCTAKVNITFGTTIPLRRYFCSCFLPFIISFHQYKQTYLISKASRKSRAVLYRLHDSNSTRLCFFFVMRHSCHHVNNNFQFKTVIFSFFQLIAFKYFCEPLIISLNPSALCSESVRHPIQLQSLDRYPPPLLLHSNLQ